MIFNLFLIAAVNEISEPCERRSLGWNLNFLPLPAEIIIYSLPGWEDLAKKDTKFARLLKGEVIWTFAKKA